MDGYGVTQIWAVATSAVREARNGDTFLDRIRGAPASRSTSSTRRRRAGSCILAVRDSIGAHPAFLGARTLLVGSRRRQHEPDPAAQRTAEPIGRVRARLRAAATAARPAPAQPRCAAGAAATVHREHHRGNPARDSAQARQPCHRHRRGRPLRGGAAPRGRTRTAARARSPAIASSHSARRSSASTRTALSSGSGCQRSRLKRWCRRCSCIARWSRRHRRDKIVVSDATLRAGMLLDLADPGGRLERGGLRTAGAGQRRSARAAIPVRSRTTRVTSRSSPTACSTTCSEEHGLGDRERLLLQVAALLHDVGVYVSLRAHHKHSQYILASSQIFGLSDEETAVVSNIARYHRRGLPQRSHMPYVALDREDRMIVRKLASILRVANALDAEHAQKITDVRAVGTRARGLSSCRGRATSRWSGSRRPRAPTCSQRRSAARW